MSRRYRIETLKTVKVNGVECKISVNSDGEFYCSVAFEHLKATTLADLMKQLKKATRKQQVEVDIPLSILGREWDERPFRRSGWVSGHGVQHVTAYGITVDGETKLRDDRTQEKVDSNRFGSYREVVRRLTDAEAEEYARLATAKAAASEALSAFEKRVALPTSVNQFVREAVTAKIETSEEPAVEAADPRLAEPKPRQRRKFHPSTFGV